uniref:Uncharacterized protein n=1 Tax=Candidatus Kentrum sp. SD TaxID=2126332 RepID=A0A451BJY8_9GAMM|nr:MAG: hypothetical protein BECKSD772D_GA0070982_101718 [Candidatus Kentron sp. SD]
MDRRRFLTDGPRVAARRWAMAKRWGTEIQPQRGCVRNRRKASGATPLGLDLSLIAPPRVAAKRQPWAMLRSPLGARKLYKWINLFISRSALEMSQILRVLY